MFFTETHKEGRNILIAIKFAIIPCIDFTETHQMFEYCFHEKFETPEKFDVFLRYFYTLYIVSVSCEDFYKATSKI